LLCISEPGYCVYWDTEAEDKTGAWSRKGCTYSKSSKMVNEMYLDECHCNHLTHFGQIFKSDLKGEETDEINLELISLVGCTVSLMSLCGVFITALISKKWLRGPGQKILLQMAINLALLLIMYLVAAYAKAQGIGCIIVGFFFHYSILSNFFWMAVAGYLQYYRLVRVLCSRTTKLVLKTTIVGWGVPVIPGVVVLSAGKYNSQAYLCLPDGWAFYATILAPICIVLVFNIGIFIMIFKNLYMTTKPRQHVDRCISLQRFKQLAFLFTLLGSI
jgi:7 transmembrane receptor (Secretin family)/GPCR proteolysis site, GPS, motif